MFGLVARACLLGSAIGLCLLLFCLPLRYIMNRREREAYDLETYHMIHENEERKDKIAHCVILALSVLWLYFIISLIVCNFKCPVTNYCAFYGFVQNDTQDKNICRE